MILLYVMLTPSCCNAAAWETAANGLTPPICPPNSCGLIGCAPAEKYQISSVEWHHQKFRLGYFLN